MSCFYHSLIWLSNDYPPPHIPTKIPWSIEAIPQKRNGDFLGRWPQFDKASATATTQVGRRLWGDGWPWESQRDGVPCFLAKCICQRQIWCHSPTLMSYVLHKSGKIVVKFLYLAICHKIFQLMPIWLLLHTGYGMRMNKWQLIKTFFMRPSKLLFKGVMSSTFIVLYWQWCNEWIASFGLWWEYRHIFWPSVTVQEDCAEHLGEGAFAIARGPQHATHCNNGCKLLVTLIT